MDIADKTACVGCFETDGINGETQSGNGGNPVGIRVLKDRGIDVGACGILSLITA
jgi:hypothetical protein